MTEDSWQGDQNQPESYNKWLYTYANPVNLTDPTGYQAENSCTIDSRYCQLPKFGNAVIDVQHFDSSSQLTKAIIKEIDLFKGKGLTTWSYDITFLKYIPYTRIYALCIPSDLIKGSDTYNGIVLGIFEHFQFGLETFESPATLVNHCTNGHCSSFSNEDLPSDYLGFIAQAKYNGWSIVDVANKFGGGIALTEEGYPNDLKGSYFDAFKCEFLDQCGTDNPYNKKFQFKVSDPDNVGKYKYLSWPPEWGWDKIKPIGKGQYWWVLL